MVSGKKCGIENGYDLVAPDGGWGYVICFSSIVIFIVTSGFIPSFGLMYKDLIDDIGLGLTEISLSSGINAMSFALCGFLTNALLHYMSKRQLAFVAMVLFNCGVGSMVFVKSIIPFFFWITIQGAGFGILFNLTFTILNQYFVEKSLFAVSLVQTLTAAGSIFLPQFIKLSYEFYGYHGSILMIAAVCIQGFVAVILLQPVEWHMKRLPKKKPIDELHVLLSDDVEVPTVKLDDLEPYEKNPVHQLENHSPDDDDAKKSSWFVKTLKGIFDVESMKIMITTNVSWSSAVTACVDVTFTLLLPQALYSNGWEDDSVALAITLITFGDLAGRLLVTMFSNWIKIGSQDISIIGLVITALAKIGFMMFPTIKIVALVFITLTGLARSLTILFFPLMVNEVAGPEKFSSAMGFTMIVMGGSVLGLGPVFGVIRDYTGSYSLTIAILAAVNVLCGISWTIELVYKRLQKKKVKG